MNTGQKNSILDRILSSQHAEAMERLSPSETVSQLLRELTTKEADVVRRRCALGGRPPETLERIGRGYQVTRERIRQIERLAITKMKAAPRAKDLLQPSVVAVTQVLSTHGGFLERGVLLRTLLEVAGESTENHLALEFLLTYLVDDHVEPLTPSRELRAGWKLKRTPPGDLRALVHALTAFFERRGSPLNQDVFVREFLSSPEARALTTAPTDEAALAAVDLATALGHNPFGEYGLASWGPIHPRRMNDKIRLVLERAAQPLHFTEIAKRINEAGFDDRTAYPPTIHNELILDDQYVLVGRGIYALRAWGYRPGVVADVIADILRESDAPLNRAQLVDAVLKRRLVKRNTVHLALTNRGRFARQTDGTYRLAGTAVSPPDEAPPHHA